MPAFHIQPLGPDDKEWVRQFIKDHWAADKVVAHGVVFYPHELPGFAAIWEGKTVGLVTYHVQGDACEIVTLDSLRPSVGVGTGLIEAVEEAARRSGCRRLWLVTTNDNLNALRFYQKRGFRLAAIHRNALELARSLKPEIPLTGLDGIPLRDEIELEMPLSEPKVYWTFRSAVQTDWPQVATLLDECDLPLAGAEEHLASFLLAFRQGRLVGTAGLELHGNAVLLRSVAVAEGERGKGLGQELVRRLLDRARGEGKEMVVLLTTTAASFFPRFGFQTVTRDEVPPSVRASQEFLGACPTSATVMRLNLHTSRLTKSSRVVVVTGGARGIGRAIVERFLTEGSEVVIGDILPEPAELGERGGVTYHFCDLSSPDSLASFAERVTSICGRVDVLVNNAGTGFGFIDLLDMSPEYWDKVMNTNLRGAALLSRALLKPMIAQRSGVIINIASSSALVPEGGHTAYASSKAGLTAFTRCLAREVGGHGVRVVGVVPGWIATEGNTPTAEDGRWLASNVSLGRAGRPDEVAEVVWFLASGAASYISGQSVIVDGGML